MLKYGAHTFLWIDEWTTEKGNKAIAAAAETGFDFIEISFLRPEEFDVAAHKKALTEAGIEATGSLVLPEWASAPCAFWMCRIGHMRYAFKGSDDLAACEPVYLRKPDARLPARKLS